MASLSGKLVSRARPIAGWADRFAAVDSVVIFGSRVRDDYTPESDLDVWVEVRADAPPEDLDA